MRTQHGTTELLRAAGFRAPGDVPFVHGSQMYAVLSCGRGNQLREIHLVDMVARIAGKRIAKRHNLSGPQGVRGRNSDNTRLREALSWEPSIRLEQGLAVTL